MRVNLPHRVHDDESGAVLAIVVLSLAAIIGMVVLVVDVGGLLNLRRRLVTAADSAALAAAQSCALEDPVDAPIQADALATANQPGAGRTAYYTESCGTSSSGRVQLAYERNQTLFFAPAIGANSEEPVGARAEAIWGPAGGITPVPIELSIDESDQIRCANADIGTECSYWHDNKTDNDFGDSSNWGFMNLNEWEVSPGASCSNAGTSERRDWITEIDKLHIRIGDGVALACADSGHSTSSWLSALESEIGQIRYFPVNDPDQMVLTGGKEKYAIIGFIPLRVDAVLKGNDPEAVGLPGASGHCSGTHSFSAGGSFDLDSLGCYASADSISNFELKKGTGKKETVFQEGVDYAFDPISHVVTWTTGAQPDVSISFDWAKADSEGKCGSRDPDPNAVCLVLSWQGPRVAGSIPGGGVDFGLRAVRLDG